MRSGDTSGGVAADMHIHPVQCRHADGEPAVPLRSSRQLHLHRSSIAYYTE